MNSAFYKLPEEKRDYIIKICLEEFANNGYDNTSTDVITCRAGISKGILFHYFKSKKNLYLFLINYVINLLSEKTFEEFDKIETQDFFEKMKQLALIKQKLSMIYRNESKLIFGVMTSPSSSVMKELDEIRIKSTINAQKLQEGIIRKMDISCLREGIKVNHAVEITQTLFSQLTNKYLRMFSSGQADYDEVMDKMVKELDEYCDIVKHGIYA